MENRDLESKAFNLANYYNRKEGEGCGIELREMSRTSKSIQLAPNAAGGQGIVLDINAWLPAAAEKYNISKDIRDYILTPVPALITELPNTNGDSVSKAEMLDFKPKFGMPAYKTFKGKPTHSEHANRDYTKAKGIILDSYLKPMAGFMGNHAKLMLLLAYDRTRDPVLCDKILRDENTHSVGFWYTSYTCSFCGHLTTQETMHVCSHTKLRKRPYILQNRLVYRECHDITGFECSHVGDPAYVSNQGNLNSLMMAR